MEEDFGENQMSLIFRGRAGDTLKSQLHHRLPDYKVKCILQREAELPGNHNCSHKVVSKHGPYWDTQSSETASSLSSRSSSTLPEQDYFCPRKC